MEFLKLTETAKKYGAIPVWVSKGKNHKLVWQTYTDGGGWASGKLRNLDDE